MARRRKGFTLIELMIVFGLIAAVTVIFLIFRFLWNHGG